MNFLYDVLTAEVAEPKISAPIWHLPYWFVLLITMAESDTSCVNGFLNIEFTYVLCNIQQVNRGLDLLDEHFQIVVLKIGPEIPQN